jgi:hypothetical protein
MCNACGLVASGFKVVVADSSSCSSIFNEKASASLHSKVAAAACLMELIYYY